MRIRVAKPDNFDGELFGWFCHARNEQNNIAIEFQCSDGRLQRFKKQWNITWQVGDGSVASQKWRENVIISKTIRA